MRHGARLLSSVALRRTALEALRTHRAEDAVIRAISRRTTLRRALSSSSATKPTPPGSDDLPPPEQAEDDDLSLDEQISLLSSGSSKEVRDMVRRQAIFQQQPVHIKAMRTMRRVPYIVLGTARDVVVSLKDPRACVAYTAHQWGHFKSTMKHYWLGVKLLRADVSVAIGLGGRVIHGYTLTRRERKQLARTVGDVFRLVPMAFFILIPAMEFLLPVALYLFPSMLPSTFQDSMKQKENAKRDLKARLEIAHLLQDATEEMARSVQKASEGGGELHGSAGDLIEIVDRVRSGEPMTTDSVIQLSRLFSDEITLDNISRGQLVTMCQFIGLSPYGPDALLRARLRYQIRTIKADDVLIRWEGVKSLSTQELVAACSERGMRAYGLNKATLKHQLNQWLDLSVNQNVPISLLVISRALAITAKTSTLDALAESISALDEGVVAEAILDVATVSDLESETELRKLKLDSLSHQRELMDDEREELEDELEKSERKIEQSERKLERALSMKEKDGSAEVERALSEKEKTAHEISRDAEKRLQEQISVASEHFAAPPASEAEIKEVVFGDKAEVATEEKEEKRDLSAEEIEALVDLSTTSLVDDERKLLQELKKEVSGGSEQKVYFDERSGNFVETSGNDPATAMVKRRLGSMLESLEDQLKAADTLIGDSKLLDMDGDGVVTTEELKAAISNVLKEKRTAEEVESIVRHLDLDDDMRVTIEDLEKFQMQARKRDVHHVADSLLEGEKKEEEAETEIITEAEIKTPTEEEAAAKESE